MEKYLLLTKLAKSTLNIALKLIFSVFFSSLHYHLGEKLSLKKRHKTVPRRSEMQSEYKEKQEDAKGKLQSDIQWTFC